MQLRFSVNMKNGKDNPQQVIANKINQQQILGIMLNNNSYRDKLGSGGMNSWETTINPQKYEFFVTHSNESINTKDKSIRLPASLNTSAIIINNLNSNFISTSPDCQEVNNEKRLLQVKA